MKYPYRELVSPKEFAQRLVLLKWIKIKTLLLAMIKLEIFGNGNRKGHPCDQLVNIPSTSTLLL